MPPPAPPRRLPKAITVAEVERLLDAAGPGPDDPSADPRLLRDRALLEFLYGTGARISEATGLDVDELHLDDDPVVRLAGKGGKQRVVPVGSYAARALQGYLVRARPALAAGARRASVSPAVFLNARGGRLTRQGAWGILHGAAGRAGLPEVSPHTLRHSFRHPPAGRRGRHPGRPGAARSRLGRHHPGLHPDHRGPAARGVRVGPPAGPLSWLTSSLSTWPSGASRVAAAYASPRVAPWLTITTRAPCLAACRTYRKPDITVSEEPRTTSERPAATIA